MAISHFSDHTINGWREGWSQSGKPVFPVQSFGQSLPFIIGGFLNTCVQRGNGNGRCTADTLLRGQRFNPAKHLKPGFTDVSMLV
ncbi:hypothetical protein ACQ3G6_17990 [Allorhizobium undicola]